MICRFNGIGKTHLFVRKKDWDSQIQRQPSRDIYSSLWSPDFLTHKFGNYTCVYGHNHENKKLTGKGGREKGSRLGQSLRVLGVSGWAEDKVPITKHRKSDVGGSCL